MLIWEISGKWSHKSQVTTVPLWRLRSATTHSPRHRKAGEAQSQSLSADDSIPVWTKGLRTLSWGRGFVLTSGRKQIVPLRLLGAFIDWMILSTLATYFKSYFPEAPTHIYPPIMLNQLSGTCGPDRVAHKIYQHNMRCLFAKIVYVGANYIISNICYLST